MAVDRYWELQEIGRDLVDCPNCAARMFDGECCPTCEHDARDIHCDCQHCKANRDAMRFDDDAI